MGRNMYSLILTDEIVAAVDRLAYERHVSRSGMVDRILAGYFSCATPQMRIRSALDEVGRRMEAEADFQVCPTPGGTTLSIHSALPYRYRPTVRYVLEFYSAGKSAGGELRVSLRTQSRPLMMRLDSFFETWEAIENREIGGGCPGGRVDCGFGGGRYRRRLMPPPGPESALAEAAARYIRLFDRGLKAWLAGTESPEQMSRRLMRDYRAHLDGGTVL